jgi:hypothetical protein
VDTAERIRRKQLQVQQQHAGHGGEMSAVLAHDGNVNASRLLCKCR